MREKAAFRKFAGPVADTENIASENNQILQNIVTNMNQCTVMGVTTAEDITEVIDYNQLDLTIAELCEYILEEKDFQKNAKQNTIKLLQSMGLPKNFKIF